MYGKTFVNSEEEPVRLTTFDVLSLLAAFSGVALNLILFPIFILQLRELRDQVIQARQATERDHLRRQSQATIEFYRDTIEKRLALREHLPDERDEAGVKAVIRVASAQPDGPENYAVKEYLSFLELLATGVNTQVMEVEIMDRIAGSRIAAAARNYRPWIDERRTSLHDPRMYEELVRLGELIDRMRQRGE